MQQHDAGEKAPHGQSSDEADDAELADQLQKASSVAGTSRKGHEGSDGPRSVDVVCDDGGSRTLDTSSKVTVSGVDDDHMLRLKCLLSAARRGREEAKESFEVTTCEEISEDTEKDVPSPKCGTTRG